MNKIVKIFVADDDPSILEVIEMMLTEEGYEVEKTSEGETLYKMKKDYPDLILLDIWMSGMDGRDICKYLKTNEETKNIPVIMVSANKDTALIAREAGADDFLAKPFEMDDLFSKIRQFTSTK